MAACMVVGALGLAGCNASGSVSVQPNTPAATSGTQTSARSNFELADADAKATTASDLTLYRCEFDEATKIWVYFYYSPSQNKSYRCKKNGAQKVEVVEVTGAEAHNGNQTIDKSTWKVDSTQVQTIVNQTVNVNVTNNVTNNITNLTLISADECKTRTGKDADGPVWVAIVNNVNTYISANTGSVIVTVPTTGASATPSTAPSMAPSTAPSAMPSANVALSANLTMTGAAEVPPVATQATGTVMASLNAERTTLTLTATTTGLSGAITGAHIHKGAETESGPVVKELTITSANQVSVTWTTTDATAALTPELLADLVAGRLYVNVHTAANPNGEIRAQLKLAATAM
jgi:hypothetical protein